MHNYYALICELCTNYWIIYDKIGPILYEHWPILILVTSTYFPMYFHNEYSLQILGFSPIFEFKT